MAFFAVPLDERQERAHAVHRAEDIDPEEPVQLRGRDLMDGPPVQRDAGIVDANMNAAELRLDLARGVLDCRPVGHVERQCERAHAERRHLMGRALDLLALDVGHGDVDAFLREGARDAEPDAVRRAGDEGEFPGKFLHRLLPLRCRPPQCWMPVAALYSAAARTEASFSTWAASLATDVPSKKRGFCVPHNRTALAKVKSRKSSGVMKSVLDQLVGFGHAGAACRAHRNARYPS